MSLENVRIVLVSPLYGGNVGAVCRAMANMGLSELAIAAPRPLDMEEARMMACHASGILESRREFPDLGAAVSDCRLVAGATARPGLYRQHVRSPREQVNGILAATETGKTALVFGPEDNGLKNEQLMLCQQLIRIPTTDEFSSLNLAQAVMVCCYELFVGADLYEAPEEKSPGAPSEMRERMLAMWRETLLTIGFMDQEKADHMMHGVRRILARGNLTIDDVHILMGIARQASWAAERGAAREGMCVEARDEIV